MSSAAIADHGSLGSQQNPCPVMVCNPVFKHFSPSLTQMTITQLAYMTVAGWVRCLAIKMARPLVLMDLALRSRTTSNSNRSSHRQLYTVTIMSVMSVADKVSIQQIPDGWVRCLDINMARPLVLMDLALPRTTITEIILT
jgi:hypothetical protein